MNEQAQAKHAWQIPVLIDMDNLMSRTMGGNISNVFEATLTDASNCPYTGLTELFFPITSGNIATFQCGSG